METEFTQNNIRVKSNNKHSNKISWYRRNALEMVRHIDMYLQDHAGVKLPAYYKDYKDRKAYIMQHDAYGDALELEYQQLIKFRYDLLQSGKAVYALFEQDGAPAKTQMLACWYSKNRLDPVWNYRKSQLIRKIYRTYLQESQIHLKYDPAHLVLTVPHADGKFMNSEFYVKEITKCFNTLRKTDVWKQYVNGGEYGIEVKKGKEGNGLHIHIHSLVFLNPNTSINEAREKIKMEWLLLTGATFVHLETLYFYKRNEQGAKVMEWAVDKKTGKDLNKQVPKKFYINRHDAPTDPEEKLTEYLYGVMECIKYHFKNDTTQKIDGAYDIPLMIQVLNNTKGVRLYSRFGSLYKVPELNFNFDKKTTALSEEEQEDEVMASTDSVLENLINPFTKEIAVAGAFKYVIAKPENLKHYSKNSETPFEPQIYTTEIFYETRSELDLKGIMKLMVLGKFNELFEHDTYIKYRKKTNYIKSEYKYKNTQHKIELV